MISFVNQIFYGNNKFDISEDSLEELRKWSIVRKQYYEPDVELVIPEPQKPQELRVEPRARQPEIKKAHSTLFWCAFISQYGHAEYRMIGNRYQNRELEEKQKIQETLSKTPKLLKEGNQRITNEGIQEVLSGLFVSVKEDHSFLVAYAAYYKKTIYVVFADTYLVFSNLKEPESALLEDTWIFYQTHKHPKYGGSYSVESEPTLELLSSIREKKVALVHYTKPLNGTASYKMSELEELAGKIGILETPNDTKKKWKKTELYSAIADKCGFQMGL